MPKELKTDAEVMKFARDTIINALERFRNAAKEGASFEAAFVASKGDMQGATVRVRRSELQLVGAFIMPIPEMSFWVHRDKTKKDKVFIIGFQKQKELEQRGWAELDAVVNHGGS